jgi:hypothetical protein
MENATVCCPSVIHGSSSKRCWLMFSVGCTRRPATASQWQECMAHVIWRRQCVTCQSLIFLKKPRAFVKREILLSAVFIFICRRKALCSRPHSTATCVNLSVYVIVASTTYVMSCPSLCETLVWLLEKPAAGCWRLQISYSFSDCTRSN